MKCGQSFGLPSNNLVLIFVTNVSSHMELAFIVCCIIGLLKDPMLNRDGWKLGVCPLVDVEVWPGKLLGFVAVHEFCSCCFSISSWMVRCSLKPLRRMSSIFLFSSIWVRNISLSAFRFACISFSSSSSLLRLASVWSWGVSCIRFWPFPLPMTIDSSGVWLLSSTRLSIIWIYSGRSVPLDSSPIVRFQLEAPPLFSWGVDESPNIHR